MKSEQFVKKKFSYVYHFPDFYITFICGQLMPTAFSSHISSSVSDFLPHVFMGSNCILNSLLNLPEIQIVISSYFDFCIISMYSIHLFVVFTVQLFFLCSDTSQVIQICLLPSNGIFLVFFLDI